MHDIVERLRGLFSNSYGQDEIERAIDILEDAADEIERLRKENEQLRSQMDLFDPNTTQEMAAATLNFANDAIGQLQERNHALREALQLIADPLRGPDVTHYLVVAGYQSIARKALEGK